MRRANCTPFDPAAIALLSLTALFLWLFLYHCSNDAGLNEFSSSGNTVSGLSYLDLNTPEPDPKLYGTAVVA